MEYLPLIIILGGLGAMAYFFTKSGKDTDNKRAEIAAEKGWGRCCSRLFLCTKSLKAAKYRLWCRKLRRKCRHGCCPHSETRVLVHQK